MKIVKENFFISKGSFSESEKFQEILKDIRDGIALVNNPFSSQNFKINPVRRGNGVKPIKNNLIVHLGQRDWLHEQRIKIVNGMAPGPIDSVIKTEFGHFALEWETGNISSSHRALNKMAVGMIEKNIIGGILILPTKDLSQYLTDRVGNYEELESYFVMYNNLNLTEGILGVISVTYDEIDADVPLIPKGQDGNSKKEIII
ncbi:Restriction endonuclease BamHI [Dyadobacter koreensis]|uniref:Restriction endonuclease BamHI n=1 Tax=Dyadobacter koreensis TaxID=408657 RepID=A0A1H6QZG6_9BACT|nr:hypothetical protein [Dyadobacter koreensis]SEI46384.1 Restriction endonuclease BamHI [Dyadobacter koreensis]